MKKDKTMNIKTTIVLLCVMLVFAACSKEKKLDENSFEISGTITGNKETQMILMEMQKAGFTDNDTITIDEKGRFGKIIHLEQPTLFSLSYAEDYIVICPQAKERIKINAQADNFSGTYTIEGSKESELLKELNVETSNRRATLKGMSDFLKTNNINNFDSIREVFLRQLELMKQKELQSSTEFIRKNKGSLTTLVALYRTFEGRPLFDYRSDLSMYKEVLEGLKQTMPENQHTLILENFVKQKEEQMKKTQEGNEKK